MPISNADEGFGAFWKYPKEKAMAKSFKMVVEQDHSIDREIEWEADNVPRIITIGERLFVCVGKYLTSGDDYSYHEIHAHEILSLPEVTSK